MGTIIQNSCFLQYGPKVIPGLRDNQNLHLLAEKEFDASTTSTTASSVGSMVVDNISAGDLLIIDIRDVAGRRANYFFGADQIIFIKATGSNTVNYYTIADNAGAYAVGSSSNGVYVSAASLTGKKLTLSISQKYNASSSKTIDGTYRVRVYKVVL